MTVYKRDWSVLVSGDYLGTGRAGDCTTGDSGCYPMRKSLLIYFSEVGMEYRRKPLPRYPGPWLQIIILYIINGSRRRIGGGGGFGEV